MKNIYCPFCGRLNLGDRVRECAEWIAQSTDPTDEGNEALLTEYQCENCDNRSFWI